MGWGEGRQGEEGGGGDKKANCVAEEGERREGGEWTLWTAARRREVIGWMWHGLTDAAAVLLVHLVAEARTPRT